MRYMPLKWFFVVAIALLVPIHAGSATFSRNLSLGSEGGDVRSLQVFLNADPDTRLATDGVGSSGQETTFFGPLTRSAVVRFQEKYAESVLLPLGLRAGTGFFGPSSRARALALGTAETLPDDGVRRGELIPRNPDEAALVTAPGRPTSPDEALTNFQRNQGGLETLLAGIRDAGAAQGLSTEELSAIEADVRIIAATTTDLTAEFVRQNEAVRSTGKDFETLRREVEEQLQEAVPQALQSLSRPFATLLAGMTLAPAPKAPLAQFVHFGGRIAAAIPCTCSFGAVWKVGVIGPRPVVGDYIIGTQRFLNFNFPALGINTLGKLVPGPQLCFIGVPPLCGPIPGVGLYTPIIGTSLTPL